MIKIVIIENEEKTQTKIKNILKDLDFLTNEEAEVLYFTKYNKELKQIIENNAEPKIYILDINLETKVSGIDIAKFIRTNDWESEIIFITNHDKMFETVYRSVYKVFDFIEKFHNLDHRLKKDLKLIYNRNFDNKMFKYQNQNLNIQIYYHSIIYIYRDKEERKAVIKTDKNEYYLSLTLIDILKMLDNRFKMVHRSCIVNTDRIEEYKWSQGYFQTDTGEIVYMLSKKHKDDITKFSSHNS